MHFKIGLLRISYMAYITLVRLASVNNNVCLNTLTLSKLLLTYITFERPITHMFMYVYEKSAGRNECLHANITYIRAHISINATVFS